MLKTPQANSTAPLYPPHTTLLAVAPTSLTSFTHVALSLSPPSAFSPTLVTLDPSLSPRLPFPLKRGLISSLSRAGVAFELVLRGVTRLDAPGDAPGDAGRRRRNWIAGAREVVRATEGRGVVLSSGATRAGEMRAPEDLINLCAASFSLSRPTPSCVLTAPDPPNRSCSLIGLPPSQAKDALTVNPQRAILRGRASLSFPPNLCRPADARNSPPARHSLPPPNVPRRPLQPDPPHPPCHPHERRFSTRSAAHRACLCLCLCLCVSERGRRWRRGRRSAQEACGGGGRSGSGSGRDCGGGRSACGRGRGSGGGKEGQEEA